MKGCPQKAAALLTHGVVLSVECDDSCTCPGWAFGRVLGFGLGLGCRVRVGDRVRDRVRVTVT